MKDSERLWDLVFQGSRPRSFDHKIIYYIMQFCTTTTTALYWLSHVLALGYLGAPPERHMTTQKTYS